MDAERTSSSPGSPRSPRPVLATMTPVPVHEFAYCHKVEMDDDDGYPADQLYADSKAHQPQATAVMYQHEPSDLQYDPIDEKAPIDLIYEDGKQTVIYTTTPDQKRVEMMSAPLDVSVVVQHDQPQPAGPTVLVLADHMLDDAGQYIGTIRRRRDLPERAMQAGEWRSGGGDHPLLLEGSGGSDQASSDGPPTLLYDYYKLPPLPPTQQIISGKDAKFADIWPGRSSGAELTAAELQGLLSGGGSEGAVKREPEDLSRKVAHAHDRPGLAHAHAHDRAHSPSAVARDRDKEGRAASPPQPDMYQGQMFAGSGQTSPAQPYQDQYAQYSRPSFAAEPYYREYFAEAQPYQRAQQLYEEAPQERYARPYAKAASAAAAAGLTVDLPSPDSGIGADAVTPREQPSAHQSFEYAELCQQQPVAGALEGGLGPRAQPSPGSAGRSRPWHDFGRQNDADKIQIPKLYSPVGFKYNLESPISSSQRKEDDRITYINKGQFYGISLEYVHDPEHPIKNQTVKSVVMLMFREEKSPEDEIKAWQFWHGRQHSVKQRILDADTKNSVGLVGCIEEVAHNAIAVYWNPLESSAKINVAVQCLSTDFSSQKGVKGLPLHLQIDTFEDPRDPTVFHRGYCQIKVFCDKGAERKTRDEERRAAKRKMTATGRKKLDELYHPVVERSEFYSMSDLNKPPVLFTPAEDLDKIAGMELQGFYGHDDGSLQGESHLKGASPFLLHAAKPATPTLKFHNHFPPDAPSSAFGFSDKKEPDGEAFAPVKRARTCSPPLSERVMLYVRQDSDDVYTPLHVVPPTTQGLLHAIENKYKIPTSAINNLYRKNNKGITAKIDDDMLAYYCNEDLFLLEVRQVPTVDEELYDITFVELLER